MEKGFVKELSCVVRRRWRCVLGISWQNRWRGQSLAAQGKSKI